MKIYAMSDIHGCINAFEHALSLVDLSGDNRLVLCGDYVHGGTDSYKVIDRVMEMQKLYGNKVVALIGNHEEYVVDKSRSVNDDGVFSDGDEKYTEWMKTLPQFYETDRQIFCHSGICEDNGANWKETTTNHMYTNKFPAQFGAFYKDIVSGHIRTSDISGDAEFHDILFDGQSHYFIDGATARSGIVPLLMYDTDNGKYYSVKKNETTEISAYNFEK